MVKEGFLTQKAIEIRSDGQVVSHIVMDDSPECAAMKSLIAGYRKVYVVVDRNVMLKCATAAALVSALSSGTSVSVPSEAIGNSGAFHGRGGLPDEDIKRSVPVLEIDAREENKTMDTVLQVCGWLLERGADRDALVLGVGGGIVLDITGFSASIYKRGVRFAYVPTTLLAQVDAGIGGKTGVNFDKYKNILGIIRQPEFTYQNVNMLVSLTRREFLSGAAEMLKTFIIRDDGNYCRAVDFIRRYVAGGECDMSFLKDKALLDGLSTLVAAAAAVKASVVSRDQFERGERRKLNLGHTFAHAIETLCRRRESEGVPGMWDIAHGEAVAVGMVMAARLAESLGKAEDGLEERLKADFLSCGLPIECPFGISEMVEVMSKDKKAEGGVVHFVLPLSIGHVETEPLAVAEVISMEQN